MAAAAAGVSPSLMRHSMSSGFVADAAAGNEDRSEAGSVRSIRRLNLHDRANSDTNLAHPEFQSRSSLSVDKYVYVLNSGEVVNVSWNIQETVGGNDWIGLFVLG